MSVSPSGSPSKPRRSLLRLRLGKKASSSMIVLSSEITESADDASDLSLSAPPARSVSPPSVRSSQSPSRGSRLRSTSEVRIDQSLLLLRGSPKKERPAAATGITRSNLFASPSRSDDFFSTLLASDESASVSSAPETNSVFAQLDDSPRRLSVADVFGLLIDSFFADPESPACDDEVKIFLAVYPVMTTTAQLLRYVLGRLDPGACASTPIDETPPTKNDDSSSSSSNDDDIEPSGDEARWPATVVRCFLLKFVKLWLQHDPRVACYAERLQPLLGDDDALQQARRHDIDPALLGFRDPGKLVGVRSELKKAFFRIAPVRAAQMLERCSMALHARVTPSDLYFFVKDAANAPLAVNPCRDYIDHFNNTVSWIQTTCLSPPKAKKRSRRIAFWIDVAVQCLNSRFLSCLLMISTALHHQTVSRLRETWALIPAPVQELYQQVTAVASPLSNFSALRQLAAISPPVPLPLSIHTKDLVSLLEVVSIPRWERSERRYPYLQLRVVGKLLEKAAFHLELADSAQSSKDDSGIEAFLANPVPRLPIEKLYSLSYSYERPPVALTPETAFRNPLLELSSPRPASRSPPKRASMSDPN